MAKKYTRKQVSSLAELDLEQERIKYKTRRIENDVLDMFDPQQLAITLIGKLLSRKATSKTRKTLQQFTATRDKKTGNTSTVKNAVAGFAARPAVKSVAKKLGISFLKWQAFNLALFAGKKIIQKVKERRHSKKLLRHMPS